MVRRCEDLGIPTAIVPRLFERMPALTQMEHLGGLPLVAPRPADPTGWQFRVKYVADRALAAIALLVLSPILIAAAVAVLLSMGRPVFFRQLRIGRDGRPFEMLKFRSMAGTSESPYEAPDGDLAPGGVEGEDRRTRVGAFLRKTSIDELPQLINVLRGEMSMIGPRPERPEFVRDFEQRIHRYGERHRVKSGITGWAQVHGLRGRTSLADRAEWDNFYIENFTLWLDLKIALMTVRTLFRSSAAVE
jgi:exopolysaccharide biosynthesis polyprenyl glycosylphosphotransferase